MSDVQQLLEILHALNFVFAMPDFIGKDDVEKHLRWSATNYFDRIFNKSNKDN